MDVPKKGDEPRDGQITTIIEDITNRDVASISSIDDGMTANNWTVEPRIVWKG